MQPKRTEPEKNPWFLSGQSTDIRYTSIQAWTLMAWRLLENPQDIPPALVGADGLRVGLPWVRIWVDPRGLDPDPFTLTVFQPFEPDPSTNPPIVRKAVWRRSV